MADSETDPAPAETPLEVQLRDPYLALFLAWLVPGLGHLYQGRWFKGIVFAVCILGLFVAGLVMSDGRAVYVPWNPGSNLPDVGARPSYLCQLGAGAVSIPALLQARWAWSGERFPGLNDAFAPPRPVDHRGRPVLFDPRRDDVRPIAAATELDVWNRDLGRYWDLATVYTMIAGLLNVLAMYDAFGGPVMHYDEKPPGPPRENPSADKKT